jgi:hypothetical protein
MHFFLIVEKEGKKQRKIELRTTYFLSGAVLIINELTIYIFLVNRQNLK